MSIQEPTADRYINDNVIKLPSKTATKKNGRLELVLLPPADAEEVTQEKIKHFYKTLVNILMD